MWTQSHSMLPPNISQPPFFGSEVATCPFVMAIPVDPSVSSAASLAPLGLRALRSSSHRRTEGGKKTHKIRRAIQHGGCSGPLLWRSLGRKEIRLFYIASSNKEITIVITFPETTAW